MDCRLVLAFSLFYTGFYTQVPNLCAQEDKPVDQKASDEQILQWIEQLASPQPALEIKIDKQYGNRVRFDKAFKSAINKPVADAIEQLLTADGNVEKLLMAHTNDARHSITVNSLDQDYNLTVTRVCEWIVENRISFFESEVTVPYKIRSRAKSQPASSRFMVHSDRKLVQMQVDSLNEWINFYEKLTFEDVASVHPDAMKPDRESFAKHKTTSIEKLKAYRAQIEKTNLPEKRKQLTGQYKTPIGLPGYKREYDL